MSLADVYDALTSERCYKKAFTHEQAVEMICNGECGSFNPLLLECMLEISDKLKTDINGNPRGLGDKRELQKLTDEIINNDDLAASGQMLQQIEFERMRSDFYESELPEMFFSYQMNPPVLTLSESGAKRLGISRVISDPLENEEVKSISNGSLARLVEELSAATAENPEVSIKGSIVDDEKEVDCEYHCKTLWRSGEIPVKTGVAGVIIC